MNTKHRPIRSYVRREGRITPAQQRALDELLPRYGIDMQQSNFRDDLGRYRGVITEIGFGNGQALLEMASARPVCGYLGIDIFQPGVGNLLRQIEVLGLDNIRVANADAVDVLRQYLPPESLLEVWIMFPDPWPKKRHHKRRLIQPAFVDLVTSRLRADGRLRIATDWQDYAEHIEAVVANEPQLTRSTVPNGDRPVTKYEKRGVALGHRVWDMEFQKRATE
ncbi:MAG: tRNA (guanosine(46)-N7)-methyltransferase TrmB [Gammaproteobacteria bacterium]|nr:tRNA (guanosine(46)-N7)-methyltransferase TrmB [Gammaproteobacteria bacterium]